MADRPDLEVASESAPINQHSTPHLGWSKNIPLAAVAREQAHQNCQCKVRKERAKTWPKSFAKRRSQCVFLRAKKTFDTRFPDDTMVLEGHFLFKAVRGLINSLCSRAI